MGGGGGGGKASQYVSTKNKQGLEFFQRKHDQSL